MPAHRGRSRPKASPGPASHPGVEYVSRLYGDHHGCAGVNDPPGLSFARRERVCSVRFHYRSGRADRGSEPGDRWIPGYADRRGGSGGQQEPASDAGESGPDSVTCDLSYRSGHCDSSSCPAAAQIAPRETWWSRVHGSACRRADRRRGRSRGGASLGNGCAAPGVPGDTYQQSVLAPQPMC